MTALNPNKGAHAFGTPAERYILNEVCANPGCANPADSAHHIFGRPPGPYSDSWFVRLTGSFGGTVIIPHVVGLCGSGTTGCHGDVEEHRAWIKMSYDLEFEWHERFTDHEHQDYWERIGPLDPQPVGRKKTNGKPKRKNKDVQERATRTTISIGVPQGFADGGAVWDDLFGDGKKGRPYGRVRAKLDREGAKGDNPIFEVIVDMANDWLIGNEITADEIQKIVDQDLREGAAVIQFDIYGKPEPAGSKKAFVIKGTNRAVVTDANPKVKAWKETIREVAAKAIRDQYPKVGESMFEGPLVLDVVFQLVRPKSSKRKHPTVRPDATKLLRGLEDALTGVVYKDDAQIVDQRVRKVYGDTYVTSVMIRPKEEA